MCLNLIPGHTTTANGTLTHACREVEELTVSSGPTETASLLRCLNLVIVSLNGSCGFGNAVPEGNFIVNINVCARSI